MFSFFGGYVSPEILSVSFVNIKSVWSPPPKNKLASLEATLVRNSAHLINHLITYLLTGVKCRATSVAKNTLYICHICNFLHLCLSELKTQNNHIVGFFLDGFFSLRNVIFFTLRADYDQFWHVSTAFNWLHRPIMSVGPGKGKFWTRHLR